MSHNISFIKPMTGCSLYLVVLDDMVVGSVVLTNSIITNIDINGDYLDTIKDVLINRLLYELGLDHIDLICNPICFDYYSQLGFKVLNTEDKLLLRYKM